MNLGDRMKSYEAVNRNLLVPNMHTVIRLDGRSFSKFTKRFKKPFDDDFVDMMNKTTKYLCENMQNVKFGYVQSDEISLYISDLGSYDDELPFKGNIQKLVSITASMAGAYFSMLLMKYEIEKLGLNSDKVFNRDIKLPEFDSRVFQLPNINELINCFIWRQRDCVKNSISSVGQANFSPSELKYKHIDQVQEMLFTSKGINWNEYPIGLKRGRMVLKNYFVNGENVGFLVPNQNIDHVVRSKFLILDSLDFSKFKEYFKTILESFEFKG